MDPLQVDMYIYTQCVLLNSPQRKALLHTFLKDLDLKPTQDNTADVVDYYATQISMVCFLRADFAVIQPIHNA